ncbi:MAG: DUF4419 domain-containing protein [Isosphaeraceae bacterium]
MMNDTVATTFEVSNVERATALLPEVPYKEAIEALLTPPISDREWYLIKRDPKYRTDVPPKAESAPRLEACARYHGRLVAGDRYHPLIAAAHRAFMDHRPLCLTPDVIWLTICQGVSNHVNVHAERLRPLLVRHEGKIPIVVRRDDFVKGSPENPWPEVFTKFSGAIREHVGPNLDLFLPDFSTTGAAERAAAEIVLLETMRSYFKFRMKTRCGIPEIRLEGTPGDWRALADRVEAFAEFELDRWVEALRPILRQFERASRGDVDRPFWQSLHKLHDESGGPYVTGWITAFLPYLKGSEPGPATFPSMWLSKGSAQLLERLLNVSSRRGDQRGEDFGFSSDRLGPTIDSLPGGLSVAPFRWNYLDRSFDMEFLGGFVGVAQDERTLALRPEIGWGVREVAAVDGDGTTW